MKLDLRHGRLVGVAIPAPDGGLLPDERSFAATLSEGRRPSWVAGRVAMRAALADLNITAGPILPNDRGAPTLPPTVAGSISHKPDLAVALVRVRQDTETIGVDIELEAPLRVDVSRRVLTPTEAASIAHLPDGEKTRQLLLRLSAKESLYKALDPFVRRYVGFHEAEIDLATDGEGTAKLTLTDGKGPFAIEITWQVRPPHVLTTALIRAGTGVQTPHPQ